MSPILVPGRQKTQRIPRKASQIPFILIGKSTMAFLTGQSRRVLKSWYTGGGPEQEFRRCFADEVNLAPFVQILDSAIHRINHYPIDRY